MILRALMAACLVLAAAPSRAAGLIVTNGDTLVVNGTAFRLDGIDAPQTDQTCLDQAGAVWRCGIAARDQLEKFIGKRDVRCDDVGPDPNYRKRRIGLCRIEGESGSLNQWLVREGWALNLEPGAKGRFSADREYARENRKGLWSGCFVSPQTLRRWNQSVAKLLGTACPTSNEWKARNVLFPESPTMPPGCSIKGKVAARALMFGSRGIYHLETCRSYRRTKAPERWFCSEDEAKADGFRKSHTC